MVVFTCRNCGHSQPTTDDMLGKKATCPECGQWGTCHAESRVADIATEAPPTEVASDQEHVIECPFCRLSVQNSKAVSGQLVDCPHCGRQFQMPHMVSDANAEPTSESNPTFPGIVTQDTRRSARRSTKKSTRRGGRKEIRACCNACGHIWHYLPGQRGQEFGEQMGAFGQEMTRCGCSMGPCCCLTAFMPTRKPTTITSRCPKCNSASIRRETVIH